MKPRTLVVVVGGGWWWWWWLRVILMLSLTIFKYFPMCECVVFNVSQGWNCIATAWFHSGGLNTNHHLTSLISPDIWTHSPRTTINREFKPRISQNKWQCAKLIKTSTNQAGVAKLYAKPRFSKQMKISFDVLTLSIYFLGKSCRLF